MKPVTKIHTSEEKIKKSKSAPPLEVYHSNVHSIDPSRPTPLNFDEFIPWMCLQYMSSETVTVIRMYQEEYVKANIRRASSKSVKSVKAKLTESQEFEQPKESGLQQYTDEDSILIKAYYDYIGQLQEVSIVGCPFEINRTVMQILSMAIPYHQNLYKLTISKGGLTATALVEIGKVLPQSYLTDVCFDDTNVPQKNYTILLQNPSRLKSLSLNRCKLGDETCKEIIASIDIGTAAGTLRVLELSSNMISDEGALAFADLLRRNRHLLHLNLSGNIITDVGAMAILNTLMEFPMRRDEISDMKRNRLEYNRQKISMYDQYVKEIMVAKHRAEARTRSGTRSKSMRSPVSNKQKSPVVKKGSSKKNQSPDGLQTSGAGPEKVIKVDYSHPDLALKAAGAVGEFHDPFDAEHIVLRDRYYFCVGNMFLCSLNLAYNNLEYSSIKKIHTVLEYQSEVKKPTGTTGLLRIAFEGNYVPKYCDEYVVIDILLQNAISTQLPKSAGAIKKKIHPAPSGRKSASMLGSKI